MGSQSQTQLSDRTINAVSRALLVTGPSDHSPRKNQELHAPPLSGLHRETFRGSCHASLLGFVGFFLIFIIYLFVYLTGLGLSCGMWDL